jgi:hypothetical protein
LGAEDEDEDEEEEAARERIIATRALAHSLALVWCGLVGSTGWSLSCSEGVRGEACSRECGVVKW